MLKLLLLLFFAVCTLTEETDSLLSVSWKEGKAKQSDDYSAEFGAKNAVDGDLTTCAISCSTCIKQNIVDELAWWQYDLGEDILVRKIIIIASTRSFEAATLENFVVIVRPTNSTDNLANPAYLCAANHRKVLPASNLTLDCGRHIKGRYVTIKRQGGRNSHLLVLCHVSIYAQVIERSTTTIKTTTTKDDNNNNNNNNNSNKDKNNNNNNNNGDNTLTTSQKTSFSASNKKNDQQNDNEKTTFGLSNGSIRGIIISCVFLFLIILLIILFFFLFRFSFKKKKPGTDGLKKNTFLSSNQTEVVRNEDALLDEFMNLPEDFMFPATTALEPNNSLKNSFINTIPYDYNRVQLPGDNDYINGSYIKGFDAKLKYICAQTPTEETLSDWWRMVDCSKIRTCVSFCPMPGGWTRAGKTLNPIDDSHYNLYSKFTFSDEQLQRVFTFFQINDMHNKNNNKKNSDNKNNTINSYNNNHNDNVNDDALEVVFSSYKVKEILNLVRQHPSNNKKNNKTNNNETKRNNRNNYNYGNNSNESTNIYKYDNDGDVTEKILVQCRAGISLSGCLIACDISLDEFELRGEVDLANNVAALRRQRANLLNTMELYRCAHQVLSEHKSLFGTDDDRVWLGTGGVQDRLKSQYEVLVRMTDAMQQSIKKPRWIQKYKKDEWYVVLKDGALQLNYVVECCKTLLLVDAPFPKFLPLEEGQETCYEDEADEDEVNGKKHGEKNGKERKMFRRIICTGIVPCGENITFYTYSIFQKESLNAPPLSPLPPLQFSSPFCYQKTFSIVHFKPSFSGLGIQANQYVMLHGLLSRDADTSTGNLGISCETTSMAFNTVAILHALDRKMFESVDDVISSCRHVGCGWNFVSMEGFLLAHEVLNRSQHGLKVKHNQ